MPDRSRRSKSSRTRWQRSRGAWRRCSPSRDAECAEWAKLLRASRARSCSALTALLACQCVRRNKEREQAHDEALKQLDEATKQAEYRKRIANAEISRARKGEEKAIEDLQAETAKLDLIKKSADNLRAKVESLEHQLKAEELRTDDLAQKLSQERNRLLQLKFKNTLGVDAGAVGQAGSEVHGGVAVYGKGDAALAHARQERQHIKRLVDFFKHKLAADLESWRRDGCAWKRSWDSPKHQRPAEWRGNAV